MKIITTPKLFSVNSISTAEVDHHVAPMDDGSFMATIQMLVQVHDRVDFVGVYFGNINKKDVDAMMEAGRQLQLNLNKFWIDPHEVEFNLQTQWLRS